MKNTLYVQITDRVPLLGGVSPYPDLFLHHFYELCLGSHIAHISFHFLPAVIISFTLVTS